MLSALLLTVTGASFGLGPEWQAVADPLAEARAGKIYCDTPDHKAKTCEGAVFFRFAADGEITSVLMIPVNNEPDLMIAMPLRSWIDDGALCSRPEQTDVDRMRLLMGAKPYEKPAGEKLLGIFKAEFAPMVVGKTMCEHMFAKGDRRFSVGVIDGIHRPELDGDIAWLGQDDLYDLRATENFLDE